MTPMPSLRARLTVELLREGRSVELPATGTSMRPLIWPGDVVRVEPATVADVRPGDVVLVDAGDRLVCHRLVYVAGGRVVTRGDDLREYDPPLPAAAIVGRVPVSSSPRALYTAVRALLR